MFAIEFRSGSYLNKNNMAGSVREARQWSSRDEAEAHLSQHSWLGLNGGMVVEVDTHPPAPKVPDYSPGDIVALKSGGPDMTVNAIYEVSGDVSGGFEYLCVWVVEGHPMSFNFHEKALIRILSLGAGRR